jgi:hypothetical protein
MLVVGLRGVELAQVLRAGTGLTMQVAAAYVTQGFVLVLHGLPG